MVSNAQVHEEFHNRFYRQTSKHGRDISIENIDRYVNEAYRQWFKNRVALAQTNAKVRYDLQKLQVTRQNINCADNGDVCIWEFPPDYYQVIRQKVFAKIKDCDCEDGRDLIVHTVQSDDWEETVKDPFWKPSYDWEETIGRETEKGYAIAVNGFCIEKVDVDYYRRPKSIHSPSLKDCAYEYGGVVITEDSEFELDDMQLDEVIDLAILNASRDSGDSGDFSSQIAKVNNNNNFPNKNL
jgi:hypothetical protein